MPLRSSLTCCCARWPQAQAQAGIIEQQQLRLRDLEGSARQWEARCSDLRDVLAGHEQRAKEAAAEVLKGNQIIEKLSVGGGAVPVPHDV